MTFENRAMASASATTLSELLAWSTWTSIGFAPGIWATWAS